LKKLENYIDIQNNINARSSLFDISWTTLCLVRSFSNQVGELCPSPAETKSV
jgi:hypothetical protein